GEHPPGPVTARARLHAARIRAVIRLGEPEAADRAPGRHLREPAPLLLLAAPAPDPEHAERTLDGAHRTDPAIPRLETLHDEAVGDVGEAGAAVAGQVRTEDAELGHAGDEGARELLARMAGLDHRQRLPLDEAPNARADHPLVLAEQLLDP